MDKTKNYTLENISIIPFTRKRKVGSYYYIRHYACVITEVKPHLEAVKQGMNHWLYDLKVIRPLNLIDRLMKYIDKKKLDWYLNYEKN